ncbi:uncharacterized protein K452DRAFT_155221 [Aplosporella prunicola CBS 121167]|uniref:Uncharacterized protein n=1 Tax=Aplosporella prunicola CBS 121167 TaxID=1176127 RepID=A0A6A6BLQ4_9PEZI|nr:uncharacterized protein K452DRAFT_155221 [Aplosporella prunicola CBS 121167]KAF2144235.1 hypothetical protein K452DRAFT_155221 [Aplosporella prunicola CBS 121167]
MTTNAQPQAPWSAARQRAAGRVSLVRFLHVVFNRRRGVGLFCLGGAVGAGAGGAVGVVAASYCCFRYSVAVAAALTVGVCRACVLGLRWRVWWRGGVGRGSGARGLVGG